MPKKEENKWLLRHGAKALLTIMLGGAVVYISNLTSTVWSNESRIEKIEPEIGRQQIMLKNQCQIMRHFKIGNKEDCI